MTIVVTGGGSGGHITPILAVAHELKQLQPTCRIVYIGQKGDPFADIPERDPNIDQVYRIQAGKFRRYYGEGLRQLLDVKTMALNVRDISRIARGILQARRLMKKLGANVVFSRGGYVSVPVALGARANNVPYITHDSDAIPSLANRLIAKGAAKNAVALPAEIYPYDQSKTVTVGVPVRPEYVRVTPELQNTYRQQVSLPHDAHVVFASGGGLGARSINDALLAEAQSLLQDPTCYIIHQAGKAHETAVRQAYAAQLSEDAMQRVRVFGYMDDIYLYAGAADVIVTRAGASSIADYAVQGKACIIVPSPFLTGGHQLKNAQFLHDRQAAEVVDETAVQANPAVLTNLIRDLLGDPFRRQQLGDTLTTYGHRDSARELAQLIINEAMLVS
jgi:UDP-N-acetylglucosamine--N-acetylmuramyl-(pentapeptide) pyrophosphoryl-undecaprenol N-acetylglucosamine transferase